MNAFTEQVFALQPAGIWIFTLNILFASKNPGNFVVACLKHFVQSASLPQSTTLQFHMKARLYIKQQRKTFINDVQYYYDLKASTIQSNQTCAQYSESCLS